MLYMVHVSPTCMQLRAEEYDSVHTSGGRSGVELDCSKQVFTPLRDVSCVGKRALGAVVTCRAGLFLQVLWSPNHALSLGKTQRA